MDNYLKKNGFKKVFPDDIDKTYFYYQKNIKHNFLKKLHVIVCEKISVYCTTKIDGCVTIHQDKTTEINLKNILSWLEK